MIYLKNTTDLQNVYIPRRVSEESLVKERFQNKKIELVCGESSGEYVIYPDADFVAMKSLTITIK